ncbi:MAG: hydantoinase B/oxoprolinase family protein [Chloroflexi bacterium]|nr:hydantoinase B/oxoprolinase family protein [Chloroflexota bacterium]
MTPRTNPDPTALAVFHALFASVAEEMGVTLGRSAHSPNITERRDFSCAVFDADAKLVAQAAHIPVHLGAMPVSIQAALPLAPFAPGDVVILNDPYLGGTHLPDITLISPVFEPDGRHALVGYLVSRAHHADVGGMTPGSMPLATELYQEGVIIPPLRLLRRGRRNEEALSLLLRNVRTPGERRGDLDAQLAAHRTGEARLLELVARYGRRQVARRMRELQDYAERLTRAAISDIPNGVYEFEDALDDDGASDERVTIQLRLTVRRDRLHFDFTGSAAERPTSVNAVAAVTRSAVYYVVRCLLAEDAPTNDGCLRPITLTMPKGSVVNARPPRAVSAGNVETSQRIVDVVLGALAKALPDRIPAASAGTMNNVTIGGFDSERGRPFAYYETLAGGAGAGPTGDGLSAVHTHMTNTMNTPVEVLELTYPFRVREYAVRRRSGGTGSHTGGDGLVREYEFLSPAQVTIVGERRRRGPWGLRGGESGATARDTLILPNGRRRRLPSKGQFTVEAGARLRIETPGGGGWSRKRRTKRR